MDYNYLVFLYFTTIITPSVILAVFYGLIYRVILRQVSMFYTGEENLLLDRRENDEKLLRVGVGMVHSILVFFIIRSTKLHRR